MKAVRGNGYQRVYDLLSVAFVIGLIGAGLALLGVASRVLIAVFLVLALGVGATLDRYGPSWLPTYWWVKKHLRLRLTPQEARQVRLSFVGPDTRSLGSSWDDCLWVRYFPTEAERRFALLRYSQSIVGHSNDFAVPGLAEVRITPATMEAATAFLGAPASTTAAIEDEFFRRFADIDLMPRHDKEFAEAEKRTARLASAYRAFLGWE